MFPLGIKNTLARIINRPLPIRAATSPVTDAYNVALDHDWSNTSIDQSGSLTVNLATTIPAPGAPKGPSPYDPYSPDLVTVHQPTRALDHEKDSDLLNDPLRELIQVPPTQIHDSVYRKQLPILIYDHNSDPNRVIPTGVGQNLGRPTQIRSPTPSTKTRPLFLPSRPSTPAQMMNTQAEKRKRDKAPPVCRSEEPVPDKTFKRRRIDPEEPREPDILELSDDEPDSYGMKLTDTGYQSSSLDDTLNELINAYESVKNRLGKAPSVPSAGPSPPQRARPQPPPAQHTREWFGPTGGPIKFYTKPENFNEGDALRMRWSYTNDGPDHDEVEQQTEGDIHFCPSRGRGTNEPFKYWVCVETNRGLRWASYSIGQQHPSYRGFVLKAAVPKTKNPPRWVKESSFKSGRS